MASEIDDTCPGCGSEVTLDTVTHREVVCGQCFGRLCRRCIDDGVAHECDPTMRGAVWTVIPNPELHGDSQEMA